MHQILVDGRFYAAHGTAEEAEAAAYTLRRWSSTSTRIEVAPAVPARCRACRGTGVATRLVWRKGWVWGDGPCRACGGSGAVPEAADAAAA